MLYFRVVLDDKDSREFRNVTVRFGQRYDEAAPRFAVECVDLIPRDRRRKKETVNEPRDNAVYRKLDGEGKAAYARMFFIELLGVEGYNKAMQDVYERLRPKMAEPGDDENFLKYHDEQAKAVGLG